MSRYLVACDAGGTMTDVIVVDQEGREMPNPAWIQVREFICPGRDAQHEVEAVPRGCPPDMEFLPDLDTFYREWLGRPLPDTVEFKDCTLDRIREWSE